MNGHDINELIEIKKIYYYEKKRLEMTTNI